MCELRTVVVTTQLEGNCIVQSHDIEEGTIEAKLKVEQVVDMLVKAYTNSDVAMDVMNYVNELSKEV